MVYHVERENVSAEQSIMKRGLLIWWLGVLIFVCLFADSTSSTPPNVEQKSQTHTKDKEQPTITDRRGTESSPVFIKVLPPLPVEPNPAEHAQRSSGFTSPEWWLVWVTLSLAAITAFLAIYGE
ncbi:MAG: hypothetical protein ABIU05_23850, partial [Nitrospirales bacterium]